MLASTPPTFLFVLAWVILSSVAPVAFVVAVILTICSATRQIGVTALLAGFLGAALGTIGDGVICIILVGNISHIGAIDWTFAALGGFSLFSIPATLIKYERTKSHVNEATSGR
jgi:Na+/phosphate symporter